MIKRVLRVVSSAVFPEDCTCVFCDKECVQDANGLCAECAASLRFCNTVPQIRGIDEIRSGVLYEGGVQNGIYRFKYHNQRYLAPYLANFLAVPNVWECEMIVPTPLSQARFLTRGYNQVALIAYELGKRTGIPVREDVLIRVKDTAPQYGLSLKERARNMRGAFQAHESCKGKTVLLLDDIYTTGSTLRACAKALRDSGVKSVYALTVCHAPREK